MDFNSPGTLTIDDSTSFTFANQTSAADFAEGDFGIHLVESPDTERSLLGDDNVDQNVFYYNNSNWYYDFSGKISGTGIITGAINSVLDGWERFKLSASVPPSLHIDGQGGDDYLGGLAGQDEISGGDGNDVIVGDAMIIGSYPNLPSWNGAGAQDILRGDAGRDAIFGWYGNDVMFGGEDGDFLSGEQDDDFLDGGNGDDLLAGGSGADQLLGGAGNDVLLGDGQITSDVFWQSADIGSWELGLGYDEYGRISSITPAGYSLSASIAAGNDFLAGGGGNDYLGGGDGDDTLFGEDGHDRLIGGSGVDFLDGGAGNDLLFGQDGNDTLNGGAGTDELQGGIGEDILHGGAGNDTLFGEAGNDILSGESGNDYLDGGEGNDVYFFGFGSGHDTIFDSGGTSGDTVRFSQDITPHNLFVSRYQNNLVLQTVSGNDALILGDWFVPDVNGIEHLVFADGTTWDKTYISSLFSGVDTLPGDGTGGNNPSWELDPSGSSITMGGVTISLPNTYQGSWVNGMPLSERRRINMYGNYWRAREAAGDISVTVPENKNIYGSVYDDNLYGGAGDDTLYGYEGDDYLSGGAGSDKLHGGVGNDKMYGGDGRNYIYGDEGDDYLLGGNESNSLYGGSGNDTIHGGEDWDGLYGDAGEDWLYGGGESDWLDGGDGGDYLYGEEGDDTLEGGLGSDYLSGGAGNDYLWARNKRYPYTNLVGYFDDYPNEPDGTSNDILEGGGGDDQLYGNGGTDILDGGPGNDYLEIVYYSIGNSTLLGGAGDDFLKSWGNKCTFIGGPGNDRIEGTPYVHWSGEYDTDYRYVFGRGDGNDVIVDWTPAGMVSTLYFMEGISPDDILLSRDVPYPYGGEVYHVNLVLTVRVSGESVTIQNGFNSSIGRIKVQFADDAAWYLPEFGGDPLTVSDPGDTEISYESIRFSRDIDRSLLRFFRNEEGSLIVDYAYSFSQIEIEQFFNQKYVGNSRIDALEFEDGTVWNIGCRQSDSGDADLFVLSGGAGDDELTATMGDDIIQGGAGDDALIGLEGDDVLYGGAGDDNLYGDEGDDILDGGAGNDILEDFDGNNVYIFGRGYDQDVIYNWNEGGFHNIVRINPDVAPSDVVVEHADGSYDLVLSISGTNDSLTLGDFFDPEYGQNSRIDAVEFADGTVWNADTLVAKISTVQVETIIGTVGNDILTGTAGDDILIGGTGNDTLSGGTGDDTFRFSFGDGQDTINPDDIVGTDTLAFGTGITLADLQLQKVGSYDLVIKVGEGDDQVKLTNWFHPSLSGYRLDLFTFADGTTLTLAELLTAKPVYSIGTAVSDSLQGHEGVDIIAGDAGSDALYGYAGNDILQGGFGADTLTGGDGSDLLVGGAGNDILSGGAGDDTFSFSLGDGQDTINPDDIAGTDTLAFGAGITLADLQLQKVGSYDLVIKVGAGDDQVKLTNWFHPSLSGYRLDLFAFADGTTLTLAELLAEKPVYSIGTAANDSLQGHEGVDIIAGDAGNDALYGYAGNDILQGGFGADTLTGGDGSDLLVGGAGNDILSGGAGDDTFSFGLGDGQDTINPDDITGTDTLAFGEGITLADLQLLKVGSYDLLIKVGGGDDQVKLTNWFHPSLSGYRLDLFAFADGTTLTLAELLDEKPVYSIGSVANDSLQGHEGVDIIAGDAGNDALYGYAGNDILQGGLGTDTLTGGDGSDLLVGGVGNDILSGGAGDDTFSFSLGDGQDTINPDDIAGTDTLAFGERITLADLQLVKVGSYDLVIKVGGGDDQVKLTNWFHPSQSGYRLDLFSFADGTELTLAELLAEKTVYSIGTAVSDSLLGHEGVDIIAGDAGNDTLYGYAGNDILQGGLGADTLVGGDGNDLLVGGTGNDTLIGGSGADTFIFNSILDENTNKDTISDFNANEDKISLHNSIFKALIEEGTLSAVNFHAGSTDMAADDNDYILYNTTTGALSYDADGNGQGVAVEFAVLSTKPQINEKDFVIASL
jgi:Ca2+-binding RTX toxin-like protein